MTVFSDHPAKWREDAEHLSNPNLVDLTFCNRYFPNFDSPRVHVDLLHPTLAIRQESLTLFNVNFGG